MLVAQEPLYTPRTCSPPGSFVRGILRETQVQSKGQEDLLEEEMPTHSSILAWKIPWTEEEPGGLQSMKLQKVGHD